MKTFLAALVLLVCMVTAGPLPAQKKEAIYDESKVPSYTLPDPLVLMNRKPVKTPSDWIRLRRPEIHRLFSEYVYGITPHDTISVEYRPVKQNTLFLGGKATLQETDLVFSDSVHRCSLRVLLIVPNNASQPAPVFLGLNFEGNHTLHPSVEISLANLWDAQTGKPFQAGEKTRGMNASRWPVEKIIDRGYALASCYYGDIDPDFDDGFGNGVHVLFSRERTDESWGSIGTWAWGLSRILDFLSTVPEIDPEKVAVMGHSRLGKAALWAGASDERFALVISNNSGCGGAALFRRKFGETVEHITTSFPHWFCKELSAYAQKEELLPVDQHMLISLIAPRPVYVASAEEDLWADPKGEFLSTVHAQKVYELLGREVFRNTDLPEVNKPINGLISYHLRTGKHDITLYDWEQYLRFADLFLRESNEWK